MRGFADLQRELPHYGERTLRRHMAERGIRAAKGKKKITFDEDTFQALLESF